MTIFTSILDEKFMCSENRLRDKWVWAWFGFAHVLALIMCLKTCKGALRKVSE